MVDHAGLIEVLENYPVIAAVKSHRTYTIA